MTTIKGLTDGLTSRALREHLEGQKHLRLTRDLQLYQAAHEQIHGLLHPRNLSTIQELTDKMVGLSSPALTALLEGSRTATENYRALVDTARRMAESPRGLEDLARLAERNREAMMQIPNSALMHRQLAWADGITAELAKLDAGLTRRAIEAARPADFGFRDQLREALRNIDFPFHDQEVLSSEDWAEDIATAVERAAEDPDHRGIGAAVAEVLSRVTGLDESGRAMLFYVVLFVVLTFLRESIGSIVEVEYDRWRNAPDDEVRIAEVRRQTEIWEDIQHNIEDLSARVANPPMAAEVIRSARMRSEPDTAAPQVRRLEPGTHLLVTERRDGWVRVEAEPTPGDVFEGWVYGRLVRYIN